MIIQIIPFRIGSDSSSTLKMFQWSDRGHDSWPNRQNRQPIGNNGCWR